MYPAKGPLQLFGVGDVVDAVQTAHAGINGAVQVQPLHGLAQKDGLDGGGPPVFLCRLGQHLRGQVHPDHFIPPPGQFQSEGAGAAGQVQHGVPRQAPAAEVPFDVISPGSVVHIPGELVVAAGQ